MDILATHPAILALKQGCRDDEVLVPQATAVELVRFLQVKRLSSLAQSLSSSPGMDRLWRWMLLNTELRDEIHKFVGGNVPRGAARKYDSEEDKVCRMVTAMYAMRRFGFPPTISLWTERGTLAKTIRAVPVMRGGVACDEVYVCDGVTSADFIENLLSSIWNVRVEAPSANAGYWEIDVEDLASSAEAEKPEEASETEAAERRANREALMRRNGGMLLYVKTPSGKTYEIHVEISDTIAHVKEIMYDLTGDPVEQQRIIFAGRLLENDMSVSDYNISVLSTLYLVFRLRQG